MTNNRIPPGQRLIKEFPVLDLGVQPTIALDEWSLTVSGEIENPQTFNWETLQSLPQQEMTVDIHCVTHWTIFDMFWVGVPTTEIANLVKPKPQAHYVVIQSADNYTTNLPLAVFLDNDVLLAHSVYGKPLSKEHGGPVRLVVPKRYFWKSAKWVTGISFCETDQPGFWETRGYHNEGDPFKEERYW